MSVRNTLFILTCLIAVTASVVAIRQSFLIRELRGSLQACEAGQTALQNQMTQLEDNLHSAGLQMSNLSGIIQEATQRAARCDRQLTD